MPLSTILFRIFLGALIGCLIGVEREKVHKAAGVRTLGLVGLASTLFTLISIYGFKDLGMDYEPTRIASQVVSGIGFLGAGVIIFHQDKVHNLTTAAIIWVMAAIGMALGIGWYAEAIMAAALAFAVIFVMRILDVDKKLGKKID